MIDYINKDLFDSDATAIDIQIELSDGTVYSNADLLSEEFSTDESICEDSTIDFGTCNSDCVKFRLGTISKNLKDEYITIKFILNGDTNNPFTLGKYRVFSDEISDDKEYKDITAYDDLYYISQLNVKEWYDAVFASAERVTIKDFRDSFFTFLKTKGLQCEQEETTLINDNMQIIKGFDGDSLTGGTVIKAICEFSAKFGHIGRDGNFKYISLGTTSAKSVNYTQYVECYPSDYTTDVIDCVQLKYSDDSAYAQQGTGENVYSITGNFLLFGMSETDLNIACRRIYEAVNKITYTPMKTLTIINGNPCLEVGDMITVTTTESTFTTYVLSRTLSGIRGLGDSVVANGTKRIGNKTTSVSEQLKQINGKTRTIKNTVEQIQVEFKDLKTSIEDNYSTTEQVKTLIDLSATEIKTEVSKSYTTKDETNEVIKSITVVSQTADKINWLVKSGTNETDFTLTDRTVELVTDNFTIKDSTGTTTIIQGGKIIAQSLGANEIRADELTVGKLTTETGGRIIKIDTGRIYIGDNVVLDAGLLNASDTQSEYTNSLNISCLAISQGQVGFRWSTNDVSLISNFRATGNTGQWTNHYMPYFSIGETNFPIRRIVCNSLVLMGYMTTEEDSPGLTGDYTAGLQYLTEYTSEVESGSGSLVFAEYIEGDTLVYGDIVKYNTLKKASDKRLKKAIHKIPENQYIKLIEEFDPISYIYKNDKNEKVHFGAIAQDVIKSCEKLEIGEEYALIGRAKDDKGDETYSLAYDEYIPLIIAYCQHLKKLIDNLQK